MLDAGTRGSGAGGWRIPAFMGMNPRPETKAYSQKPEARSLKPEARSLQPAARGAQQSAYPNSFYINEFLDPVF